MLSGTTAAHEVMGVGVGNPVWLQNGGWGRLPCLTPHPLSGSCFVLLRGGTISGVIITYHHIHPEYLIIFCTWSMLVIMRCWTISGSLALCYWWWSPYNLHTPAGTAHHLGPLPSSSGWRSSLFSMWLEESINILLRYLRLLWYEFYYPLFADVQGNGQKASWTIKREMAVAIVTVRHGLLKFEADTTF